MTGKTSLELRQDNQLLRMLKLCGICAGIGVLFALLLLMIFSIASYSAIDNPDAYLNAFVIIAPSIAALAAGFAAYKLHKSRWLFCGLLCGGCMTVVMFIISKLLPGSEMPDSGNSPVYLIVIICTILFACAGAFVASGSRRKKTAMRLPPPKKILSKR